MITTTKTSIDSTKNSIDFSKRNTATISYSSKSDSELYNLIDKNRSSKCETYEKDDFKDVLDSKVNSNTEDNKNIDKCNEDNKNIDKCNKAEGTDKEKKDEPKEDISEILNSILNLLNKLDVNKNELDSNNDLSNLINQLVEVLQKDSTQKTLDTDSLDLIQKLLNQLSEKLEGDNTELGNKFKNGIKDLMSEISKIMENNQTQGDKVLSLEDILKKDLSNQDSQSSLSDSSDKNASNETSKNNNEVSKEDKFLKSLLNDDKDNSLNRMNLFAQRTQNTQQGQTVTSNQQLTVNKANFTQDLIKDVKYMVTNSLKELTVKVNPGNLGEITIKLIQEDGVMKANLKANSKDTTALLTQNLVDIKKQLSEQSVKIQHVNIELYQDDTTFFKQEGFERQFSQEQGRNQENHSRRINNIENISEDNLTEEVEAIDNTNVNFFA